MKEYLDSLQNLIGYGDPLNAEFFFFGLEENGDFNQAEDIERKNYYIKTNKDRIQKGLNYFFVDCKDLYGKCCDNLFQDDLKRSRRSALYNAYLNIYNLLNKEAMGKEDFLKVIGSSCIKIFIGNINFIPRKSSDIKYSNEIELYNSPKAIEERNKKLSDFFNTYIIPQKKLTIIFGKITCEFLNDQWSEPPKELGTRSKHSVKLFSGQNYENISRTNHPSRGWLNSTCQENLVKYIK
jgi:hypothetical protein